MEEFVGKSDFVIHCAYDNSSQKNNLDGIKCNISISHDGDYAIAFVIIEKWFQYLQKNKHIN